MRSFAFVALASLVLAACGDDSTPTPPPAPDAGQPPNEGPIGDQLPVDEKVTVANLSAPVDVVRDTYGRPHIYASSLNDAVRVEGYFQVRDRTVQMDFLRRVAEGRIAEVFGGFQPSVIDMDISYRNIGLARTAQAEYDALAKDDPLKGYLDAYADGVTQGYHDLKKAYEAEQNGDMPSGAITIPFDEYETEGLLHVIESLPDWTGVDTLAMARFESYLLSFTADQDVETQAFFDAAHATFDAPSADPLVEKRAGIERDLFRFAPSVPATTTTGYPMTNTMKNKATSWKPRVDYSSLSGWMAAMKAGRDMFRRGGFGSNNWAIQATRSATGRALVASDPHLLLSAPAVFWPVGIDVTSPDGDASKDLHVNGVAFPGIPGIILGNNQNVAWGATVAGYDVSDAYQETLTPDGNAVMFDGSPVALETIEEDIKVQNGGPGVYKTIHYPVKIVPHHGPILPTITKDHEIAPLDPKKPAISIKWTGLEPSTELAAITSLVRAKNVDEARQALQKFGVGAQNWMLGDTNGDIAWTSHAIVPTRDRRAFQWDAATYTGTLPCLVLPGDGTAEWTGTLPDDLVPTAKDPDKGYLATANNDPIGTTVDNDPSNDTLPDGTPMYLACTFDIGFREGRIQERIEGHAAPLAVADLQDIQADHRSSLGARLAPLFAASIARAEAEKKKPGTHPDLTSIVADPRYDSTDMATITDLFTSWQKNDFIADSGVDPDTNAPYPSSGAHAVEATNAAASLIFEAWVPRVMNHVFDDELGKMNATIDEYMRGRALLHLFESDPHDLATFDPTTGDSAIWDDMTTPAVETRDAVTMLGLLDALDWIKKSVGSDLKSNRWGSVHVIRFASLNPLYGNLSIPQMNDKTYPNGFPRHGDLYNVDACDFTLPTPKGAYDFTYSEGPSQRFVANLDPAGIQAENALPGGEVWDDKSTHFQDEAAYWKKNATHPIPFLLADVIAAKETRSAVTSP